MSVSLEEFSKRAQEAEDKIKSLEAQIDSLAAISFKPIQTKDAEDEKDTNWEVIYWGSKNRGNFIKLVFEEANVPYKVVDDFNVMASLTRSDRIGKQKPDEGGPYQVMVCLYKYLYIHWIFPIHYNHK